MCMDAQETSSSDSSGASFYLQVLLKLFSRQLVPMPGPSARQLFHSDNLPLQRQLLPFFLGLGGDAPPVVRLSAFPDCQRQALSLLAHLSPELLNKEALVQKLCQQLLFPRDLYVAEDTNLGSTTTSSCAGATSSSSSGMTSSSGRVTQKKSSGFSSLPNSHRRLLMEILLRRLCATGKSFWRFALSVCLLEGAELVIEAIAGRRECTTETLCAFLEQVSADTIIGESSTPTANEVYQQYGTNPFTALEETTSKAAATTPLQELRLQLRTLLAQKHQESMQLLRLVRYVDLCCGLEQVAFGGSLPVKVCCHVRDVSGKIISATVAASPCSSGDGGEMAVVEEN
ncbi:unnamed protein product [Amoebophrya sp. A25]|nr:unnamed protein product [Amoebophrya sp. A25]|eukprot:GSA25T00026754001.1